MHSKKSAFALSALLLAQVHGAAAQPAPGRASAQQDIRVGSVSAIDSRDAVTDGGIRAATGSYAVPAAFAKDYRLSPNDLLEIEVLDAENLRRTVRVNAAGAISLPLIGHVAVNGLTPQEAEVRIAARYAEKYLQNPQVSIFIKEFTTERITVEGAVARPGIFPLTGQMTLLRVLAVAGGFGSIANTREVVIYRTGDDKKRIASKYDIEKIRAGEADDPPIQGDDLIVVQRDSTRAVLKDSLLRDVIDSINPFSILVPH